MKKKLYLLAILGITLLTGCTNKYITTINYNELEKMIENKETFAVEIIQTDCTYCKKLAPKLNRVLENNDIHIYQLDLQKLSEDDLESFQKLLGQVQTPTIIFITEGEEESKLYRIIGNIGEKELTQKFKNNGYIK